MRLLLALAGASLLILSVVPPDASTTTSSTSATSNECVLVPKENVVRTISPMLSARACANCVCIFDFDETLVDTSRRLSSKYRGLPIYAGIPYMIRLLHIAQKHSRIVILTARSAGAEALVARNCEAIGLRMRSSDVIATCPAHEKAAWRREYCTRHKMTLLLVAGDRDTDIDGTEGAIAVRVLPGESGDIVCERASSYFRRGGGFVAGTNS